MNREDELFCIPITVEAEGLCISQNLQNCTPQRGKFTACNFLKENISHYLK